MGIYYSETTKGFYDSGIHESLPDDAFEISDDQRADALRAQSAGGTFGVRNGAFFIKEVTEEEIRKREAQDRAAAAIQAIEALEAKQARPLRELLLDPTNEDARSRLQNIEAEIETLRKEL